MTKERDRGIENGGRQNDLMQVGEGGGTFGSSLMERVVDRILGGLSA